MKDLERRIASLPPERRALLNRLLSEQRGRANSRTGRDTVAQPARIGPHVTDRGPVQSAQEVKDDYRTLYNAVSDQLNAGPFGRHAFFCNFGYVANGSRHFASVTLPRLMLNKNTIRLVLEVVGDCPLDGCRVLDVGCGRGGTIWVMANHFHARQLVGLDLSSSAIRFDAATHRYDHVSFLEGDAEHLPFAHGSFDVVSNVESSHSYPDIGAFYNEVSRVLRPGGAFLYTDVFPPASWREQVVCLQACGLAVEHDRDITANVLLSCDETAGEKRDAYQTGNDYAFMGDFLGAPDSGVYRLMKSGEWAYRILALRKPETAVATRKGEPAGGLEP